ncbi:hypothetical protein EJ063_04525 [Vibrio aquaticus]|uniref:Uncharacterized protein n=1 Tax=Vibrio aquaticus TaxID=2496559 RepID=A0A3S0PRK1_9VIBR|nr:hypothetical protein [Vibrio aquaticus]RTZ18059.1 hypothetical protein EJ063_04525 [Vibrio aquaticus]
MEKQHILAQLFVRESEKQTLISKEDLDFDALHRSDFETWKDGKRDIELVDVAGTHWMKTCTGGYITEVIFHADGTLNEYRLFDRFKTKGNWSLKSGVLHVVIFKGENCYEFAVIGNASVNIHSAVEYKNSELHSYLKLAQIK